MSEYIIEVFKKKKQQQQRLYTHVNVKDLVISQRNEWHRDSTTVELIQQGNNWKPYKPPWLFYWHSSRMKLNFTLGSRTEQMND